MTMLAQFIAGNGIKFYTKEGEEIQAAQSKFQSLLKNTTEEQFLWQTGYDIAHGLGMSWTVRRSATEIVRLDHLDVLGYRSGLLENGTDADGMAIKEVKQAWWCSDWAEHFANKTDERFKPIVLPRFKFGEQAEQHPISVLYDKVYKPRQPYYSVPWFLGAIRACEVWEMVDEYNRNQIGSGFTPAMLLGTRFDGSESDVDKHREKVNAAFTGAQGDALFQFELGPGEEEPFFKELKRGNHAGELDDIKVGSADTICEIYGIPSILFRDRSEGLTSQSESIGQRLQQFERTLVRPYQKLITRNLVPILNMPEIWEAKIDPLQIFDPVQSEAVIMASTTVDQARKQRGDDEHEDKKIGAMLLSQASKLAADPEADAKLQMEKAKLKQVPPAK